MPVELPPGYQPSLSEDYMNPAQVEFFRRRLSQSRADLRRELEAIPPIAPDDAMTENSMSSTARGFRAFCIRSSRRWSGLKTAPMGSARLPASQ